MSLRQILGIGSTLAGAFIGGPIGFAVAIGGNVIGGVLDPQKVTEGQPLQDNSVDSSLLGSTLAKTFGTYPYQRDRTFAYKLPFETRTNTKSGGLLSFTKVKEIKNIAKGYSRIIGEGPATVLKAWYADEMVYDATNLSGPQISDVIVLEANVGIFEFVRGTHTEFPFPQEIEAFGQFQQAYRGMVREAVWNIYIDRWGGIPPLKVLVAASTTAAFPFIAVDQTVENFSAASADAVWLADQRHFIVPDTSVGAVSWYTVYDTLTQTRVRERLYPETFNSGGIVNHQDGSFWTRRKQSSNTFFYEIDTETLSVIGRTATTTPDLTHHDFAVGGASSKRRLVQFYTNGGWSMFDTGIPVGTVTDSNQLVTVPSYILYNSGSFDDEFDVTSTVTHASTYDDSDNLWVIVTLGGGSFLTLIQMDGVTGNIIGSQSLTDYDDCGGMGFDPTLNALYFGATQISDNDDVIVKFNIADSTLSSIISPSGAVETDHEAAYNNRPVDSKVWLPVGASLALEFDLEDMVLLRTLDLNNDWSPPGGNDYFDPVFDVAMNALISIQTPSGDNLVWFLLDRITGAETSVKEVTEFVCDRVGLSITDDVDASAGATQTFPGYTIDDQRPGANDVAEVNGHYFNALRIHDGKLQIKVRGQGIDKVLDHNLLGAVPANQASIPPFRETLLHQREEIPHGLIYNFRDPDKDYDYRNVVKRRSKESISTERFEDQTTKMAIYSSAATNYVIRNEVIAEQKLFEYETATTLANLEVEPGDTVQWLNVENNETITAFIERAEFTADGAYNFIATQEFLETFGLTGTPNLWTGGQDTIVVEGSGFGNVLDIPHLQAGVNGLALHPVAGVAS